MRGLRKEFYWKAVPALLAIVLLVVTGISTAMAHRGAGFPMHITGTDRTVSNPLVSGDWIVYTTMKHAAEPPDDPNAPKDVIWVEPDELVVRPIDGGAPRTVAKINGNDPGPRDLRFPPHDPNLARGGWVIVSSQVIGLVSGTVEEWPWNLSWSPITMIESRVVLREVGAIDPTYWIYDLEDREANATSFHPPKAEDGTYLDAYIVDANDAYRLYEERDDGRTSDRRFLIQDTRTGDVTQIGAYETENRSIFIDLEGDTVLVAISSDSIHHVEAIQAATGERTWAQDVRLPSSTRIQSLVADGRRWTVVFHADEVSFVRGVAKAGFLFGTLSSGPEGRHEVTENGYFESSIPAAIPHGEDLYYVEDIRLKRTTPGEGPIPLRLALLGAGGLLALAAFAHFRTRPNRGDQRPARGVKCPNCKQRAPSSSDFCYGCGATLQPRDATG